MFQTAYFGKPNVWSMPLTTQITQYGCKYILKLKLTVHTLTVII